MTETGRHVRFRAPPPLPRRRSGRPFQGKSGPEAAIRVIPAEEAIMIRVILSPVKLKEAIRVNLSPAQEAIRVILSPVKEVIRVILSPVKEAIRVILSPAKEAIRVIPVTVKEAPIRVLQVRGESALRAGE